MDKETRKAIEEAGFRVTTVKELFGLTEEENQLIELKVAIALRIRKLREKSKLTQNQLALLLRSSQSRVAKIEAAHPSVTLDLMVRAFFALGGKRTDLAASLGRPRPRPFQHAQPQAARAIIDKTKASKPKSKKLVGSEVH
jgi:transcriptional regulator with XRE-family HTH domain